MSCQTNSESEKVSSPRDRSILVYPQASASDRVVWCTHKLYLQLDGCMSMNRGQMCGPYINGFVL
ncbi:hypothetical protein KY285_033467 [Solanum tuberosum]|nr:hypothetical protein KY285_033467 [Solanum tuberosum]